MGSVDIQYKPNSKILIITIDSFFKKSGGIPEYDPQLSINHDIPEYIKPII